jgi:hypothetical protein
MKEPTVRIAEAKDSEPFAKWIGESTQIPMEDVQASLKENNPTSVTLVIEDENGKVILFVPTYAVAMVGFIGFNPEATERERVKGLHAMKKSLQAFWAMHGVTEIDTLTREDYPVAKWAMHNQFDVEPRQLLRLVYKPTLGGN